MNPEQWEQDEYVNEESVTETDFDLFYDALSEFYDEKMPLIQIAVDERIQEIMSFFASGFFVMVGLILGVALWVTLKDSK